MSSECESAILRRAGAPRTWPRPYAARTWLIARTSSFRGGIVAAAAVPLDTAGAKVTAPQMVSGRRSRRWIVMAAGSTRTAVCAVGGSPCRLASVGAAAANTGTPSVDFGRGVPPVVGLGVDGMRTSRYTFHPRGWRAPRLYFAAGEKPAGEAQKLRNSAPVSIAEMRYPCEAPRDCRFEPADAARIESRFLGRDWSVSGRVRAASGVEAVGSFMPGASSSDAASDLLGRQEQIRGDGR